MAFCWGFPCVDAIQPLFGRPFLSQGQLLCLTQPVGGCMFQGASHREDGVSLGSSHPVLPSTVPAQNAELNHKAQEGYRGKQSPAPRRGGGAGTGLVCMSICHSLTLLGLGLIRQTGPLVIKVFVSGQYPEESCPVPFL